MSNEKLDSARTHAQRAQSMARRAPDPLVGRQWERVAQVWLMRVTELQDGIAQLEFGGTSFGPGSDGSSMGRKSTRRQVRH
jgi:hypothetical protein